MWAAGTVCSRFQSKHTASWFSQLHIPGYLHYKHCTTIIEVFRSLVDYKLQNAILFFIYQYIIADNVP